MSKYTPSDPYKFLVIKKYIDGQEIVLEYCHSKKECLTFISKQKQPSDNSFQYYIGEY